VLASGLTYTPTATGRWTSSTASATRAARTASWSRHRQGLLARAAYELLPPEGTDDARRVARVVNQTRGGKLNCTGVVALPDEGGLVGVDDVRAWEGSR
jgi:hypothetical protein